MDNKKIIHVERRLCLKDSLINCLPMLIGSFIWIGFLVVGVQSLEKMFPGEELLLPLIVWLLISLELLKKVPRSVTSYTVEERYEE